MPCLVWGRRTLSSALLAAFAAALALFALAGPAVAATQSADDPDDAYEQDGFTASMDFRTVTWDTTSTPGKVLLHVELDTLFNAEMSGAVFLDTDSDGRADYAVDIAPIGSPTGSRHPNLDGGGGVVHYLLRRVTKSTVTCQSYDDGDGLSDYNAYDTTPAALRGSDGRTTFTIPLDRSAIGDPASFTWAMISQDLRGPVHYYDIVPDVANGAIDPYAVDPDSGEPTGAPADPQNPPPGESDPWYCSPSDFTDASSGYHVKMTAGVPFALAGDAPPPVADPPPAVDIAQSPALPRTGRPVTLTANATDDGQITSYAWDLDDDGIFDDASGITATRTFGADGSYPVAVRVVDDGGNVVTARRTIEVADRPPVLKLTASTTNPLKSEKFTITAEVTDDGSISDADITWGFDADRNGDDAEPYTYNTGRTWTFGFGAPGTYVVKARVVDDSGKVAMARIQITVPNQPPTFREIRVRAKKVPDDPFNKDPLVKGQPLILQALLYDDNLQRPRVEWDLDGDGAYDDAVGEQIERTYPSAGDKKAAVRMVDEGGLTAFGDTAFEVRDSAEAECAGTAGTNGVRAVGCFKPDPVEKTTKVSSEPIRLNGLDLIPKNGAKINVAVGGVLFTTGPGTVQVKAGTIVLFEGRFKMDADCKPAQQECLVGRFAVPALSNLKGFPLKGDVDVYFTPEGTKTKVNVDVLGSIGLGVTARADVLTTDKGGLVLNSLEVRSPMIPLGKLNIGQFFVKYDGKTRRWEGGGNITLPTPQFTKLSGDFAFSELTGFERAHGEVDGLNLPLDEGTVYLQRIAFTIEIKGFDNGHPRVRLGGGLGISAGPRVAGVDIATVDGDFIITFGDPLGIDVEGRISVAGFDIMGGTVTARTNGHVAMEGFIGFGLPFPSAYKGKRQDATKLKVSRFTSNGADVFNPLFQLVTVKGEARAWVEPDAFDLEASIFAKVIGITLAKAQGLISSKGVAGCGEIVGIKGGFGYDYNTEKTDLFGNSCDLGPYRPVQRFAPLDDNGSGREPSRRATTSRAGAPGAAAADAAPAATAIDVASGQKALVLKLDGTGGDPVVTLVGPDGRRYAMPATDPTIQSGDFFAARNPLSNETYVGLRAPGAGRWQIEPQPGSAPIAAVSGAAVLPEPQVTATVRGTGARRTIDYDVKPIPGQTVSFVEQGTDTHRTVGVATGSHGSLTFTPQDGAGRARKVIAIVRQGNTDRAHIRVAQFVAPALARPLRPRGLTAHRDQHGRATLSWARVPGVTRYQVVARISDGRTLFFAPRHRHVVVRNVGKRTVRYEVRAVGKLARTSLPARLRIARPHGRAPKRAPRQRGASSGPRAGVR
ncbi:MAG: domain containing protein [Solirubrobacterales bacterium]|nr:domain containing protein [Solirubrobacterales bacterium]